MTNMEAKTLECQLQNTDAAQLIILCLFKEYTIPNLLVSILFLSTYP